MALRKITIDNRFRYITKTEQTRESKLKTIKFGSLPRKQNKNLSQNSRNFFKHVAASGFAILK